MRKLYAYQFDMVRYLQRTPNAALYAQMRLGKCITTIRALKDLPGRKLIICPKSVLDTWCNELEMENNQQYLWYSSEFYKRIYGIERHGHVLPEWVICNYEAATRLHDEWKPLFQHIIVDESVNLKNPKAKLSKFLISAFPNAERKILLSGNPAPNTPLEYFSQMQFLHGEFLGCKNWWQFRRRYFVSDRMGWQWFPRASSKEIIKKALNSACYFLSRKDVGMVERKVYEKRMIEMPVKLKKEYERMEKEFVATLPETGKELETKHVVAQLNFLQQMASGQLKGEAFSDFKIRELTSLLDGELKNEQVIVWCNFRWEMAELKALGFSVINGDTSMSVRRDYQEKFKKGNMRVLVVHPGTARFGLNLSAADSAIYFNNSLIPDYRFQSEERLFHPEKKTQLLYLDLVTKETIDEHILNTFKNKKKQAGFFMERLVEEIREKYA